jgi:hypothetical protein
VGVDTTVPVTGTELAVTAALPVAVTGTLLAVTAAEPVRTGL